MYKYLSVVSVLVLLLSCSKSSSTPAPVIDPVITKPIDTAVVVKTTAKPVVKTNSQKVFVHYMPWFEDKTTSGTGKWGQHWTMANQNPDVITNGRRQIASHYYPLTGPYASSDRDIIDYQLLLMKYAGIDGVIADWNGTHNVYDYPLIKRNTDSLFSRIPGAGLQFSICYEDASLVNVQKVAGTDMVTAAKQDMAYLQSQYFKSSTYISINSQPLLLCFGPQGLKSATEWQQAFADLTTKPRLLSLLYQGDVTGSAGGGEFFWVGASDPAPINDFYNNRSKTLATAFAGAYPGFHDFYKEGGWGNNLFTIANNGTTTLQNTLNLAKNSKLPYLQLITWNDYGEGTIIEPTLDFNFDYLITIQQYTGVKYTHIELELIYKWYTLRKKFLGNMAAQQKLTQAYNYLASLDVDKAADIINGLN
ncbi:hypothetical protein SAMN05216464_106290 [Mucilaginibacter pineti]|uniref:Glycosyl hydrolase family 71 n=1 Tax=Mucilaginibacter pineti TaxID=1391627 RepID=A0A1G7DB04_9SPHI|nr:glycoside hydrolase family 71/99-like protein [Mucilaginibacter pineti]SDE48106.1 hypothetical protein SAMN05216464_106290 [Mucilaginibacter pineti]